MQLTVDLTYLNEISGGDQEFIEDILKTFLEEMPKDMEEMETAIGSNNFTLIGKVAHKTKSTLHTVGLEELKNLALKIEQTIKTDASHAEIKPWAKSFVEYMNEVYPIIKSMLNA